jgi:hypothetical protein
MKLRQLAAEYVESFGYRCRVRAVYPIDEPVDFVNREEDFEFPNALRICKGAGQEGHDDLVSGLAQSHRLLPQFAQPILTPVTRSLLGLTESRPGELEAEGRPCRDRSCFGSVGG